MAEATLARRSPKEKYPDLWAQKVALEKRRAEILAIVDPLRAQRDAVVEKIAPLEAEAREIFAKIKPHLPELGDIDNQIGVLARGMGGRSTGTEEK